MTLCESQEALRIFSVQTTAPSASHPMGAVRFTQLRVSCPWRPARRERSAAPAASPQRPQAQHQDREDVQRVF